MSPTPEMGATPRRSCDFVWARRIRRSFRLLVAIAVLLTFMLWFAEGYLRYEQSEIQYRMSLTLHPAQARPILRTVVRRETELKKVPSPLYLEALALVEEPDEALEAYARAYQANPRDMSLLLNYGCRLYAGGNPGEARERFREAGANPPSNALPRYLEAAAFAATLEPESDMTDLIALLRRANGSGDPVLFPEPLWHDSLPERGLRYEKLQMKIAAYMTEPLLQCADSIFARVRGHFLREDTGNWDDHLEIVQSMGARIMGLRKGDSPPSTVQLQAALQIQLQALLLRGEWSKNNGGVLNPEINNAALLVREALEALTQFEERRPLAEAQYRDRLLVPLRLATKTALLFFVFYAAALFLHKAGSAGKRLRALPHTWMAVIPPLVGFGVMALLMAVLAAASHSGLSHQFEVFIPVLWYGVAGFMLLIGISYPLLQVKTGFVRGDLPAEIEDGADSGDARGVKERLSFRRRMGVYGCLLRRYMGILLGGFIIMVCLWLVVHRILLAAYPFQLDLLNTGLDIEAQQLIADVKEHLRDFI
ncbi:MAG TPA: hypothetical protein PLL36_11980 [Candidatus Hydrogenedentes bacterium]|nr:MAG: hypothetical protein BWX80_03433 [Candidatus Hydrogenedentes bacterium ADurb.Bin101]HQN01792.1 hypothetical protein [Candidatus Hydrogenedentota bacterium]